MVTTLLTSAVFILALLCAWLFVSRAIAAEAASLPWRIAMHFIAEEQCAMPHEFAACLLAGNTRALAEKFPDWAAYRARSIAEWESE